jgi:ATP-binding cassette subfamily B protein
VLVDGVDTREWSLHALRSGIGKIEQDIFLFSRSIADNIMFARSGATRAQIEQAAPGAPLHAGRNRVALPRGKVNVAPGHRGALGALRPLGVGRSRCAAAS